MNQNNNFCVELVHLAPPVAVGLPTYTFHARQGGGVVLPCNATLSVPRSASLYRWLQICEGRHGRTSEREVGVDDSNSDFIITDDGKNILLGKTLVRKQYAYLFLAER